VLLLPADPELDVSAANNDWPNKVINMENSAIMIVLVLFFMFFIFIVKTVVMVAISTPDFILKET